MHIADLISRRPVPAAGVFLTLTRRCPLSCAHCSTNSMLDSEEHSERIFREFAATFSAEEHPEIVFLTGGEPLLRPDLVHQIVRSAHAAGARVALITGLYFARSDGRIPRRLSDALLAVDHVVASQDVFHEVQVPRAAAFATMRTLVEAGQDVSFQVVGEGPDDPYLADVTGQIRRDFDDAVPALVAQLGAVGRGRDLPWAERRPVRVRHFDERLAEPPAPAPCTVAAWPVVTFDGSIVACCQQEVVDGPAPRHLRLGRAPDDGWPKVAGLVRQRAALRALRTVGPEVLVHEAGGRPSRDGYCGTCASMASDRRVDSVVDELVGRPSFGLMESTIGQMQVAAGPQTFARRYGIADYAHMLMLGLRPATAGTR